VAVWLRDSDPALRWQVERDLLAEPPEVWEATRARIATEGFGARLLALQDRDDLDARLVAGVGPGLRCPA
jgi:hypothetical protein